MSDQRVDAEGHPIKDFRIAEVEWKGEPLFVLWTIDEDDGVWIMPGVSRTRQDMRTLGETIQQTGSFWHPQMARRIAHLQNEGRVDLTLLEEAEQNEIAALVAAQIAVGGQTH